VFFGGTFFSRFFVKVFVVEVLFNNAWCWPIGSCP